MSSPSVLERIIQTICDRLATITEDNGYSLTVARVERPCRAGLDLDDKDVVVQLGEATSTSVPSNPPILEWDQIVEIALLRRPSDSDVTSIDSLLNEFAADAVKAICQPTASWYSFGALAVNANWGAPQPVDDEGGVLVGRMLPLHVIYRTDENDPRNVRF